MSERASLSSACVFTEVLSFINLRMVAVNEKLSLNNKVYTEIFYLKTHKNFNMFLTPKCSHNSINSKVFSTLLKLSTFCFFHISLIYVKCMLDVWSEIVAKIFFVCSIEFRFFPNSIVMSFYRMYMANSTNAINYS